MRDFLRKYIIVTSILVLMGCIVFGAARPVQSFAKVTNKKTTTVKKKTAKVKKKKATAAKKKTTKAKKKATAAKKKTTKAKKKTTAAKKTSKKTKTKKAAKKTTAKKATTTKKAVVKDNINKAEAAMNPVANENTNTRESTKEPEANTSTNKTATAKDSKSKKTGKKSTEANREEFLEICQTMGENLNKKGFRYGWSSSARSYSSALKHRKVATCATFVSWCLQEYGVLKKGKLFYSKGGGVPNKTHWKSKKVKMIKVYKKTKNANLQPGDVICWASGSEHVCIYAGKNKEGKRTWYDAGRHQSTYGHCAGSRYKVVSARYNKYLENRLVGCVLRIQ